LEGLTEEEVLEQATLIVRTNSDAESKWRELKSAQAEEATLREPVSLLYILFSFVGSLSVIGLLVLVGIGIAKATRHLLLWPIWPFVAAPLILFLLGGIGTSVTESDDREAGIAARKAERVASELDDLLRSLIVADRLEQSDTDRILQRYLYGRPSCRRRDNRIGRQSRSRQIGAS
jgi:hypothetical protein